MGAVTKVCVVSPYVCTVANLTFPPSSLSSHMSLTILTPRSLHLIMIPSRSSTWKATSLTPSP